MFAKPRLKKSPLPPPTKKRRAFAIEEINFDFDARQEYLTGFHKRKLQRIKNAQEEAAKRARQEKLETRKQSREERRREVEQHVQNVNRILSESGALAPDGESEEDSSENKEEEWGGFADQPDLHIVDQEEEYIDEDRYTIVTVETVNVSRDGLERPELSNQRSSEADQTDDADDAAEKRDDAATKQKVPKKKKPKFRYESKFERRLTERRQKAKSKRGRQS